MFAIDNWIDYYVSLIPDPLIIDGKIQTHSVYGTYMNTREYYRRFCKGIDNGVNDKQLGKERFLDLMTSRTDFLFKNGVWKKISFSKKYYQDRLLLAPVCSGCGKKFMKFSVWGESVPVQFLGNNCGKCSKIK